jgi:hypothetical protein
MVYHYSQVYAKRAKLKLSQRTFAEVGCLVCSFASMVRYWAGNNAAATPESLDEYLDDNKGYAGDAMVWPVAYAWAKQFGVSKKAMTRLVISPERGVVTDMPVILEVKTPRNTTHFVILTNMVTGEIMDPGTNKPGPHTLKSRGYQPVAFRVVS